jgi:hypothetical protein
MVLISAASSVNRQPFFGTDLVRTGGLVHDLLLTLLVSLSFVSRFTVLILLVHRRDVMTESQCPDRLKHSCDNRPSYRSTAPNWGHRGAQEGLL